MSVETSPEAFGSIEGRTFISYAIIRRIEPGNSAYCVVDDQQLKFAAKRKLQQVIANVYEDGVWRGVKYYHPDCYAEAQEPYGMVYKDVPVRTLEERLRLGHPLPLVDVELLG